MAARANAITIPAADGALASAPKILYGWSVGESDGTPAVASFLIRDGSVSGPIVAVVELAANGSSTEWFEGGVRVPNGIFIDIVGGTVQGAIYVG
jgi:hypothetical protein